MTSPIDFAALFDIAPNAYMVLDAELRYVAANATYLEVTASKLDQLLGKKLFDLFPNDPNDPNNAPKQMLERSLERVLATGERDHLAFIPYRVPKKVGNEIRVEDRYWSATHCPVLGADGKVRYILQHTVDVTELHAERHGGETAGVLARARAVQEESVRVAAEHEGLRVLFEQAPGFMCVLEGKDHVFRLANAAAMRIIGGNRSILGKPYRDALPEVAEQGFAALLDQVYETQKPYVGHDVPVMLARNEGAAQEEVFVDFVFQPLIGEDGRSRGVFVQGHDVTERKHAERAREEARRAAEAFSTELREQSVAVQAALESANRRIAELEAKLAAQ